MRCDEAQRHWGDCCSRPEFFRRDLRPVSPQNRLSTQEKEAMRVLLLRSRTAPESRSIGMAPAFRRCVGPPICHSVVALPRHRLPASRACVRHVCFSRTIGEIRGKGSQNGRNAKRWRPKAPCSGAHGTLFNMDLPKKGINTLAMKWCTKQTSQA